MVMSEIPAASAAGAHHFHVRDERPEGAPNVRQLGPAQICWIRRCSMSCENVLQDEVRVGPGPIETSSPPSRSCQRQPEQGRADCNRDMTLLWFWKLWHLCGTPGGSTPRQELSHECLCLSHRAWRLQGQSLQGNPHC